ncbi:MAG: dipeptidase PepV, partial [Clostridia bacterium]|nr:dipeptidase PepV [Clostridia bacterium]
VTSLMDVYNKAMNTNVSPIAIGGGTYSRCLPNCVAFGPLFPGEEQTIHMPNECISLDSLKLMAELYLEAIYRLAK